MSNFIEELKKLLKESSDAEDGSSVATNFSGITDGNWDSEGKLNGITITKDPNKSNDTEPERLSRSAAERNVRKLSRDADKIASTKSWFPSVVRLPNKVINRLDNKDVFNVNPETGKADSAVPNVTLSTWHFLSDFFDKINENVFPNLSIEYGESSVGFGIDDRIRNSDTKWQTDSVNRILRDKSKNKNGILEKVNAYVSTPLLNPNDIVFTFNFDMNQYGDKDDSGRDIKNDIMSRIGVFDKNDREAIEATVNGKTMTIVIDVHRDVAFVGAHDVDVFDYHAGKSSIEKYLYGIQLMKNIARNEAKTNFENTYHVEKSKDGKKTAKDPKKWDKNEGKDIKGPKFFESGVRPSSVSTTANGRYEFLEIAGEMANKDRPLVVLIEQYGLMLFDFTEDGINGGKPVMIYYNDKNNGKFAKELADYITGKTSTQAFEKTYDAEFKGKYDSIKRLFSSENVSNLPYVMYAMFSDTINITYKMDTGKLFDGAMTEGRRNKLQSFLDRSDEYELPGMPNLRKSIKRNTSIHVPIDDSDTSYVQTTAYDVMKILAGSTSSLYGEKRLFDVFFTIEDLNQEILQAITEYFILEKPDYIEKLEKTEEGQNVLNRRTSGAFSSVRKVAEYKSGVDKEYALEHFENINNTVTQFLRMFEKSFDKYNSDIASDYATAYRKEITGRPTTVEKFIDNLSTTFLGQESVEDRYEKAIVNILGERQIDDIVKVFAESWMASEGLESSKDKVNTSSTLTSSKLPFHTEITELKNLMPSRIFSNLSHDEKLKMNQEKLLEFWNAPTKTGLEDVNLNEDSIVNFTIDKFKKLNEIVKTLQSCYNIAKEKDDSKSYSIYSAFRTDISITGLKIGEILDITSPEAGRENAYATSTEDAMDSGIAIASVIRSRKYFAPVASIIRESCKDVLRRYKEATGNDTKPYIVVTGGDKNVRVPYCPLHTIVYAYQQVDGENDVFHFVIESSIVKGTNRSGDAVDRNIQYDYKTKSFSIKDTSIIDDNVKNRAVEFMIKHDPLHNIAYLARGNRTLTLNENVTSMYNDCSQLYNNLLKMEDKNYLDKPGELWFFGLTDPSMTMFSALNTFYKYCIVSLLINGSKK